MSRRWLLAWVALSTILLLGCGSGQVQSSAESSIPSPSRGPAATAEQLNLDERTPLALINGDRTVHVGDDMTSALEVYPKPSNTVSYDVRELPKRIPNPPFAARGWSAGSFGFGLIIQGRQVAAAVIIDSVKSQADADTAVDSYKKINLPQAPEVRKNEIATYYFWNSGRQRLMILTHPQASGRVKITYALGAVTLLDSLGMSPTAAEEDLRTLREQTASKASAH